MFRIGFACKYLHDNPKLSRKRLDEIQAPLNTRTTTITWLNRQTRDVAVERLWDIIRHNIQVLERQINFVSTLPPQLRMMRIGSDILPAYTEANWSWFYKQSDVIAYCERNFKRVGDAARKHDVRLSFHPGQFVVLASEDDGIVGRSIEEFEYHVNMARWMGYGSTWHDHGFKINVHVSGRRGPQGIIDVLGRLTPEARNLITIENEEYSYGLDDILVLADHVALVLDVHHHFLHTGEYIDPQGERVEAVVRSWRGTRPTMHYSISREDYLVDHCKDTMPDLGSLLAAGYKKAKLRAHSDMYWNRAVNRWVGDFLEDFDIMCESKCKQIASVKLYNEMFSDNVSYLVAE